MRVITCLLVGLLSLAVGVVLHPAWRQRVYQAIQQSESLIQAPEILTPGPLRRPKITQGAPLTRAGIIAATNAARASQQVPPLSENVTLNQAAAAKLDDMFARQYFEHVAPDGRGPSDVVDNAGYTYIRVGENLALGTFSGDEDLVAAWMNSPGHRANILNESFSEIGVAARVGEFEGSRVWLAVQTFALPTSACPSPPTTQQTQVDNEQKNLTAISKQLTGDKASLEQQAAELTARRQEVEASYQAGDPTAEAQRQDYERKRALLMATQTAYNQRVDAFTARQHMAKRAVEQLNQAIGTYNECLKK